VPQLHASDLLYPKGELEAAVLWPGVDPTVVVGNLEEHLTEGYAKAAAITDAATKDQAARQWAYAKAYGGVYRRILALPSTVSTSDEGSSSYLLTQMEHIGELAEAAMAEFDRILAEATVIVEDVILAPRSSASVPVQFAF
jgi:hypothetical protein